MRLDTARTETITNLGGSRKFTMNATAKAFQILSSGIYERKVEAIVRELGCNAYDSHIEAGKADVPFAVHLPTPLTPVFSVEDFGVGLSEDEVYNVYTTYFESTKTDNNNVIGALGLGSKTPFSYTDSFTVTARKKGKEVVFTASIGQSGEPEVVKMYERPWIGSNGVKVEVNVSQKDISNFIQCAEKVYSWFVVKPTLNKSIMYDIDERILDNVHTYGYHLQPKDGWRGVDCKVVMGNVSYDIDLREQLVNTTKMDEGLVKFIEQLYNMKADLYFSIPIGDADVAASRETLSLDDRTKDNLIDRIQFIKDNFAKTTIQKAANMQSVFELFHKFTPFERSLVKNHTIGGYSFDALISSKYMNNSDMIDVGIDAAFYGPFANGRSPKVRFTRVGSCKFTDCVIEQTDGSYQATVIINDCDRKQGLKTAVADNYNLPKTVFVISDKNSKLTKEIEYILDETFFGCYKVIYASSFWNGKLSANRSTSGGLADNVVKAQRQAITSNCFSYNHVNFGNEDVNRWAYVNYHDGFVWIDGHIVGRSELKLIMTTLDLDGVIGLNSLNERKIKRIVPLSLKDHILKVVSKQQCKAGVLKTALDTNSQDPRNIIEGFVEMCDTIKNLDSGPDSVLVTYACMCYLTGNDRNNLRNSVQNRLKVFDKTVKTLKNKSKVIHSALTSSLLDAKMLEEIKDYIKFINRKGK